MSQIYFLFIIWFHCECFNDLGKKLCDDDDYDNVWSGGDDYSVSNKRSRELIALEQQRVICFGIIQTTPSFSLQSYNFYLEAVY